MRLGSGAGGRGLSQPPLPLPLRLAGEPRGKKFRAALDTRAKDDSLGFSSLLLGSRTTPPHPAFQCLKASYKL